MRPLLQRVRDSRGRERCERSTDARLQHRHLLQNSGLLCRICDVISPTARGLQPRSDRCGDRLRKGPIRCLGFAPSGGAVEKVEVGDSLQFMAAAGTDWRRDVTTVYW